MFKLQKRFLLNLRIKTKPSFYEMEVFKSLSKSIGYLRDILIKYVVRSLFNTYYTFLLLRSNVSSEKKIDKWESNCSLVFSNTICYRRLANKFRNLSNVFSFRVFYEPRFYKACFWFCFNLCYGWTNLNFLARIVHFYCRKPRRTRIWLLVPRKTTD